MGSRKKRKKDPNAPKKYSSAYIHFCIDTRPKIVAENPDAKGTEITKILGAKWNAISVKAKKKYQKMAEKDRRRFDSEMELYKATKEDEAKDPLYYSKPACIHRRLKLNSAPPRRPK